MAISVWSKVVNFGLKENARFQMNIQLEIKEYMTITMRRECHMLIMIACSGFLNVLQGQTIVNTETLLIQGDSTLVWTAGIGGDFSRGNIHVTDLSVDAGITIDRGLTVWKLMTSYNRLAEDGTTIQGNSFGHLRWEWGDVSRVHFFGFLQTSSNNVLLMQQRNLLGAGVKYRLVDKEKGWLSFSYGCFWEQEIYLPEVVETDTDLLRSSAIVSGQLNPSPEFSTRLTAYIQSDYRNWADSRAYVEWAFDVSLTERVAFEYNFGLRWDGEPHAGLSAWDLGSTIGLRFGFNGIK